MNKWRLLLLSALSLLQSASTERNFVDGRHRYRWSDTRFSSHEPYRLLETRQVDIPKDLSDLVRNEELTTPSVRDLKNWEFRWRSSPVKDDTNRFRAHTETDRHLSRQSTYDFNKASGEDNGRNRIVRDTHRDYRKNSGSNSSFRDNNNEKENTRIRFHSADERRNNDMISKYKRNSHDASINNRRFRMYDRHTLVNRNEYERDATRRVFRERDLLKRDFKQISLYGESELRPQTTKNIDSIIKSDNVYRSSSVDTFRRNSMNQEQKTFRYSFVRKHARGHDYMRNKARNEPLMRKTIISDESCTAQARKSEIESVKGLVNDNNRSNYERRTAINEVLLRDESRILCPEELNAKIRNTRTANYILRRNIETNIPKYRSRSRSTQKRTVDEDVNNRNIQDRRATLRRDSLSRDKTFSTDFISKINIEKYNLQDKRRNYALEEPISRSYMQDISRKMQRSTEFDSLKDSLNRSHRLSIRNQRFNTLQNTRQMPDENIKNTQPENRNKNQVQNVGYIREGRILNINFNNRERKSVLKPVNTKSTGGEYNSKDRSRNLSIQKRRTYNKYEYTQNVQDEKDLTTQHFTPVSRTRQQSGPKLHHYRKTTETSKFPHRHRSRSVPFEELVTNKMEKIRNTQERLVNVQRVELIRVRQNMMRKLNENKIYEENTERINRDRSIRLSSGERAFDMRYINPGSRKQLIPKLREDKSSENKNLQARYRTVLTEEKIRNVIHTRYSPARLLQRIQSRLSSERQYPIFKLPVRNTEHVENVHQDRSRTFTTEGRVINEITRTGDTREGRVIRMRHRTLKRETHLIDNVLGNRHRIANDRRTSTNEMRRNRNIRNERLENMPLVTHLHNEKQHSVRNLNDVSTNIDRTQLNRERITIQINGYMKNKRLQNERRVRVSIRQNSNPTVIFLVKRKATTNAFRQNEFGNLSVDKRISDQATRPIREESSQDLRHITSLNREKRNVLSREIERITTDLENTRYSHNERRQNPSSSEREYSTTNLPARHLDYANIRQNKLRTPSTRSVTNEIQHSYYSGEERHQIIEYIPKSYAIERFLEKTNRHYNRYSRDNSVRGIPITRTTKVDRFLTKKRTFLARDVEHSEIRQNLQINTRHTNKVDDIRNRYRNIKSGARATNEYRMNEYNIRERITDTSGISLTKAKPCTTPQCLMSTTPITNDTQIDSILEMKWQYLFYLLQGIYLWSLYKMPNTKDFNKKARFSDWFTSMDCMKNH